MRSTCFALALASSLVAAAATLAACGSGPASGTPDPTPTANATPSATVALAQYATSGGYATYAEAEFVGTSASASSCPVTALSDQCNYFACPSVAVAADAGAVPGGQAGTITISGPSFADGGLSLAVPAGGAGYSSIATTVSTPYFAGGDTITFAAPGDATSVGAFSLALPAPAGVVVTAPTLGSESVALTRGSDFTASWQPGIAGTYVSVSLYELGAGGSPSKFVSCVFDAKAGSGTLPSAGGIANLDPIDGTTIKGELIIEPYSALLTTAKAADGTTWSIYGTVTATSVEAAFTLP